MLEVIEIKKDYQDKPLLECVSFTIQEGELVALLGPSGSGKSTLLRIISGLESADSGQVRWQGMDLADVPAHRRRFGLMFQDNALFPFLTVGENLAFGLRMERLPESEIKLRVAEFLELINLAGYEQRRIETLSGGESQRVALARTLAPDPRLLMLDEPLGALDRSLKEDLLEELRRILLQRPVPVIYVTHDQQEAFALADRLLVLHEGRIIRSGSPAQVWKDPGSPWLAQFLGLGNQVTGQLLADFLVQTPFGQWHMPECNHHHQIGDYVTLLLRPHQWQGGEVVDRVRGIARDSLFTPEGFQVRLESGLIFLMKEEPRAGEEITIHLTRGEVQCLG